MKFLLNLLPRHAGRGFYCISIFACLVMQTIICQPAIASSPPGKMPVVTITIKQNAISVWIPKTTQQYRQGLKQLTKKQLRGKGMLFAYPKQYIPAFTMEGTLTDIALICLDEQGMIMEIMHMKKGEKKIYTPMIPCRFALELLAESVDSYQLKMGDKIDLQLNQEATEFSI